MLISDLNQKMSQANREFYLFGAHVFAQFLIQMGLNTDKVVCLLDNDPNKQARRLYGTNLKVASPRILSGVANPIVILKAGVYNQEIKKNIACRFYKSYVFNFVLKSACLQIKNKLI